MIILKQVAAVLANGFEESELIITVDLLRRANINVTTFSVNNIDVTGSHNITIKADSIFNESVSDYQCLLLPGGQPGTNNLAINPNVINTVQSFHNDNKLIAAICAAPLILNKAGILDNITVTAYPNTDSFKLYQNKPCIRSNNIITARSLASAPIFAFEIIDALGGNSNHVKTAILF